MMSLLGYNLKEAFKSKCKKMSFGLCLVPNKTINPKQLNM
jgi:hypothetical protein